MMLSQASHDFHPCQMLPICGEDTLINICLILFENKKQVTLILPTNNQSNSLPQLPHQYKQGQNHEVHVTK